MVHHVVKSAGGWILGDIDEAETFADLGLDEERSAPEATIGVLVEDRRVVLLGFLATLEDERNQRVKLGVRVARIMDMCWGLSSVSVLALLTKTMETRTYPNSLPQHESGKAVGSGSSETGRGADKALIHDGDFEEVLGQSPGLKVVVIGLADSAKETHGARPAKLKLEHAEHETLGLQDFFSGVSIVDHVDNLLEGWAVDFLILGGDENSSGTDQLQFAKRNDLAGQEPVDVVDAEEKCLWKESETVVDLHKPVHQNGAHRPLNLSLVVHVVRIGQHFDLWLYQQQHPRQSRI